MPTYTHANLVATMGLNATGTITAANALLIANEAVQQVLGDHDLKTLKRQSALSPNLFDDVFRYTCPTDLKGIGIIDIKPQIDRGAGDHWRLTTYEEFDRLKENLKLDEWGDPIQMDKHTQWLGENLVAISFDDFAATLLLSRPVDDEETVIDALDSVGDWAGYGDGENLTKDSTDYVKGSSSINWDINADAGTTAGIYNAALDDFDVTEYKSLGYIFVWAYLSSATNVTNFIIRIGSSASAYYSITITTKNDGNAFVAGWNLLRFGFANKSTTGTPDDDACDYVALYMTKDAAKVSETDYRFDNLVMKIGKHYDVVYYTKYGWQTSTGTYLENSTATTDVLNAGIEEYNLIVLKATELAERHLKHGRIADKWEQKYKAKLADYMFKYPSQALPLTYSYYNV